MKPVVVGKCAMAGVAKWIATSRHDGRWQWKDTRLKGGALDSSPMLSLLNGYRARRLSTSRSTPLPGRIGMFAARRIAVFDARKRLLNNFQCLLENVRVILNPSPVTVNSSVGTKGVAVRTQMMAGSRTGKHCFSAEIGTFRFHPGTMKKHVFTKRTQIEKNAFLHQQAANA